MAKRRRLTPLPSMPSETGADAFMDTGLRPALGPGLDAGLDTGVPAGPRSAPRAPIGQVAGEASALAALAEVSGALRQAQEEGRMVLSLPLDAIVEDHLIRDRLEAEPEAMDSLMQSLRQRGQQTPVDVTDLGEGRWGLISGWRRLVALRRLFAETRDPRFAHILALPRAAEAGAGSYVAMVEENEIRAGLSFYERARIVMRSVEVGVFETQKQALQTLFSAASYAKRSKVKSFIPVVEALDGVLRFPTHIPERTGLALSKALAVDADFGVRAGAQLEAAAPATPEAEAAELARVLRRAAPGKDSNKAGQTLNAPDIAPGIGLRRVARGVVLEGQGVDDAFVARLDQWLRDQS